MEGEAETAGELGNHSITLLRLASAAAACCGRLGRTSVRDTLQLH